MNKGVNNEKEIKESCILYYKEKKFNFCEKYNSSWLFYKC